MESKGPDLSQTLEAIDREELSLGAIYRVSDRTSNAIEELGLLALRARRFDQAIAIFEGLEALEGTSPHHKYNVAVAHYMARDYASAKEALDRFFAQHDLEDTLFCDATLLRGHTVAEDDPALARTLFDHAMKIRESGAR